MCEIILNWEKPVKLKNFPNNINYGGVYLHLLKHKGKKRIIAVGEAEEIGTRIKTYQREYMPEGYKHKTFRLDIMEHDVYEYLIDEKYYLDKPDFHIFNGEDYLYDKKNIKNDITEDNYISIRNEFCENLYITYAQVVGINNSKEFRKRIEACLIRFIQKTHNIGSYSILGNTTWLGKIENFNHDLKIINDFTKTDDWLNDLATINNELYFE